MGKHFIHPDPGVYRTYTDLWVQGGLRVLLGQAGMGQGILDDLEDPYLLEDLYNLQDLAHPDLNRQTDLMIVVLMTVPQTNLNIIKKSKQ